MQTAVSLYERNALEAGVNAARLREVREKSARIAHPWSLITNP